MPDPTAAAAGPRRSRVAPFLLAPSVLLAPCALFALSASAAVCGAQQQPAGAAGILQLERELFLVDGPSHALAYSPDGELLASGGDRGDVVLLEAATGAVVRVLAASDHWVGAVRFSPDGALLAAAGRSVTVWNVATGKGLGRAASSSPQALDWSRDGRHLALVRSNAEAVTLDLGEGGLAVHATFALPDSTAADCVALSPDGRRLAVGKRSGKTYVFDTATRALVETLEQPDRVADLAWLDDGRLLRLGWDGALRGWTDADVPLGAKAYGMAAAADGSRVLVRTAGGVATFERGGAAAEPWRLDGSGPVALHPDGVQWARAFAGQVELRSGRLPLRELAGGHRQQPQDAVLTGDGRFAVLQGAAQHGAQLQVFETASGRMLEVGGLPAGVRLLANPQGVECATYRWKFGDGPGLLQFWSIEPDAAATATARLVREQAVALELTTGQPGVPGPHLTADQRFLTFTDKCVDLLRPDVAVDLDKPLVSSCVPTSDGAHLIACAPIFDSFGGGKGWLYCYGLPAAEAVAQRRYELPPTSVAVAPGGRDVAVCLRERVELLTVPDLENQASHPWSWRTAQWLTDRYLLGTMSDGGIQVGDATTGRILDSIELPSWARRTHFDQGRGLLLVAIQDRVVLVRVALPPTGGR